MGKYMLLHTKSRVDFLPVTGIFFKLFFTEEEFKRVK